ncbi:MAG: DUF1116 domain-containing protein [Sphingomonadales bacterium]
MSEQIKPQSLPARIDAANDTVLGIFKASRPIWFDVRPALQALPGMTKRHILHAGPPIALERMCPPQRNGILYAAVFEGLAASPGQAAKAVAAGDILIGPCHDIGAVGGMAGITSASTPLVMVRDEASGSVGCSQLFQGPRGQLPSRDAYDQAAMQQWRWLADVLGPVLQAAIRRKGGLEVKPLIAKALQMGDECHNRNNAASALLLNAIAPSIVDCGLPDAVVRDSLRYLVSAEQFALCLAMATAKAITDAANPTAHASLVTAMARNGVDFGIKVAGLGDQWFTAPANPVEGLLFSAEWSQEDVVPDMGDSAIMETFGLGGHVQAAAPALQQFVNGSFNRAVRISSEMRQITAGSLPDYPIPNLDFAPAPAGIDIRKVVKTGITPMIDTAIAHKKGGVVGAGQVAAPLDCFKAALRAFSQRYAP